MAFYRGEFVVEKGSRHSSTTGGRGMGGGSGDVRTGGGRWQNAVRAPANGPNHVMHRRPMAQRKDQGTPACLGVRVRRGTTAGRRGAPVTSRAWARSWAKTFRTSLV
jgi:hypothetical protein